MPASTRTMNKISEKQEYLCEENEFYRDIKQLLDDITFAEGKTTKMIISTEIYSKINDKLEAILHRNPDRWAQFAGAVYNKTTEYEEQRKTNCFDGINRIVVETHEKEYMKARKFTASFLKDVNNPTILKNNCVAEALANIKKEEAEAAKRPRRNIPVVNYTGMDMIELYDEYDGITNIWHDYTVWYDSDYDPEEDDDDEDDEDEDDEEEFKRKMPFVAIREKKQVSIMKLRGREFVRVI